MAELELRGISRRYGTQVVLDRIDLTVKDGEFCVFVGPSGCGKSTLLRTVAGLDEPDEGHVRIGGRDVTPLAPADRGVAMVFQSYALYPHMTVARNIGFGLFMQGAPKAVIEQKVSAAAQTLQLTHLLDRRPSELSGGQRQRVAIGRALVREPDLFLFDEPLSNLDAALRVQMRIEIMKLHADLHSTMIYVTHDQVEAMTMADRIVVLNDGRVEQIGSPLDLYRRPENLFVARFIGSPKMNVFSALLDGSGDGTRIQLNGGGSIDTLAPRLQGPALAGVRPEDLDLGPRESGQLPGVVQLVERLGSETLVHLETPAGDAVAKVGGNERWRAGDEVGLRMAGPAVTLFEEAGRAIWHGSSSAR